jgi:hypothetical protein
MLDQKQEQISLMIGYARDMGDETSSDHDLYLKIFPLLFDPDRKWLGASIHDGQHFIMQEPLTDCELLLSVRRISDSLAIVSPVMTLDDRFTTDELSAAFEAMMRTLDVHGDWIVIIHSHDRAARDITVNSFFMNGYTSCGLRGLNTKGCAVYCWTKDPAKRGKNLWPSEPLKVLLEGDIRAISSEKGETF